MSAYHTHYTEYNATAARLDRKAAQAAQERIDAEAGAALFAGLRDRWYEQGYNAARFGQTAGGPFWTPEHARGYADAKAGRPIWILHAGAPALDRQEDC